MKFSIVSYRGGSGKSLLTLNLGSAFQDDAIVIEADFLAPSYHYFLNEIDGYWNDYILGYQNGEDIIHRFQGSRLVCTNPNDKKIISHLQDQELWSTEFSNRIIDFLVDVEKEYNFVMIDNQGGLFMSTVVHSFFADVLICVIRPDKYDVLSTIDYMANFKKNFYVIWNQVLDHDKMNSQIDKWEQELFDPLDHFMGTLARIPFDKETAFKRWVKGDVIIHNTAFADQINKLGQQLRDLF